MLYIPQQMKMQLRKKLKEDKSKFAHVLPSSPSFSQLNHEYQGSAYSDYTNEYEIKDNKHAKSLKINSL